MRQWIQETGSMPAKLMHHVDSIQLDDMDNMITSNQITSFKYHSSEVTISYTHSSYKIKEE